MKITFLLFDGFETLDLFGPAEIFGKLEGAELRYCSMAGGVVSSAHGARIETEPVDPDAPIEVLLVPGGMGTRSLVNDAAFLEDLLKIGRQAKFVLSVCTGSALLAKAGLLEGRKATSNKIAFEWAKGSSSDVEWVRRARWVHDGKFYTSSGVSAGMDMSLGFVADVFGRETADDIARRVEYLWNEDCTVDPFAGEE